MRTKGPGTHPAAVGDVLSRVLQRLDPDHQLQVYRIWTFWDQEVGESIARRAQPIRFRDGLLFVAVATHTWMQELRFLKDTIRDRLNARLGANQVQDIVFVSGQVETKPSPINVPPPQEAPAGPNLISLPPIANPQLASAFTRVVQARAKRLASTPPSTTLRAKVKTRR